MVRKPGGAAAQAPKKAANDDPAQAGRIKQIRMVAGIIRKSDPRALPITVLEGEGVSVEVSRRNEPTQFALRNVLADELHYVLAGNARLETDFGVLDLRPGDFVLLPRAVTYRVSSVTTELHEIIVATASELALDPQNAPGVLNVDLHVDSPVPQPEPAGQAGDFEVVIRHGREFTSYFYDYDPMPTLHLVGAPIVRRFNIKDVHGLSVDEGGLMPPRLFNAKETESSSFTTPPARIR